MRGYYYERAAVAILLVVFFAVNLLTAARYPIVWVDEVMFTDPAANLALGRGFHSAAWPYQDADRFFAGYPPLYPLLLSVWLKLVGLHPAGARALNYGLAALAVVALWLAVARLGLVRFPAHRLLLVALVLLGYGVSMGYRSGRPDTLMLLLAALALLAFSVRSERSRLCCLAGVGGLLPFSGLAVVPFALMLVGLLLVYRAPLLRRECAFLLAGLAFGVVLLLGFYALNGVLGEFWAATRGDTAERGFGAALLQGRFRHENRLPKDLSLLPLLLAGGLLVLEQARQRSFQRGSVLSFGMVAGCIIPLGMAAAGKFPTYYSWMAYVPLAVGVCSALDAPSGAKGSWGVALLLLLACLLGLPAQLALSAYDWADRDYRPVEQMVARQVRPEDRVYCDHGAYYAAKARAAAVITPRHLSRLSARAREQVSVLIISPAHWEQIAAEFGGTWAPTGPGVLPRRGTLFADVLGLPLAFGNFARKYDLQVYRRTDGAKDKGSPQRHGGTEKDKGMRGRRSGSEGIGAPSPNP